MRMRIRPSRIDVDAPAKINLYLGVRGRRADGYHDLETLFATIGIFDQLRFISRSDGQIRLFRFLDGRFLDPSREPATSPDLIVLALRALRNWSGDSQAGMDIWLSKRIPIQAGLGGGSSDAAAALLAGARLWKLDPPAALLEELALGLGSDVPFFLRGGMQWGRGRGERLTPVPGPVGLPLVVAMPPEGLSTATVFKAFGEMAAKGEARKGEETREGETPGERLPDGSERLREALRRGTLAEVGKWLGNGLQPVAARLSPWIERLTDQLAGLPNCLGSAMSGSGSACFGMFPNHRLARQAARSLSSRAPGLTIFTTATTGPAGQQVGSC